MLPDDRYRRAAAAGGVGIWEWNIVTGEVYIDRVIKEMLGYQDDEIPNTPDALASGWCIPTTRPHRSHGPRPISQAILPNTSSSIGCFTATAASDGSSRVPP